MENRISYLDKNYRDYKNDLINLTKQYYPDLFPGFFDGSIGDWMMDINSDVADGLSYHLDRAFQETNINTASTLSSLLAIARTNGYKIPGPKGAMAEVVFSCILPVATDGSDSTILNPNMQYAPIVKRGTLVSSGSQTFEVMYDIDFGKQFNDFGVPDRTIAPVRNSNNEIVSYKVSKVCTVIAGETRIYSVTLTRKDIVPFMEITLPFDNVMCIESIIVKNETNRKEIPQVCEFLAEEEENGRNSTIRFFEVDSLSEQERWGRSADTTVEEKHQEDDTRCSYFVTKGEWKPLKHKFITEYTDKGKIKIIFGAGSDNARFDGITEFSKYMMTKMLSNDALGVLPNPNSTMYIMYRVGGGRSSNVPTGSINTISSLMAVMPESAPDPKTTIAVKNSLRVVNTSPSVSGKDMPNVEEIRNLMKYNFSEQGRCVTIKDYKNRIGKMPPEFGAPFRVGVLEENNKIMIYLLNIDSKGKMSSFLPKMMVDNIVRYLEEYRMVNDLIEIKAGKVINIGFEVSLHINKAYEKRSVIENVKDAIMKFMDVNKRDMGDDIYIGDIISIINGVDGVKNVFKCDAINYTDAKHSSYPITQAVLDENREEEDGTVIDLEDSEGILYSDGDSMLEIKSRDDIRIEAKVI